MYTHTGRIAIASMFGLILSGLTMGGAAWATPPIGVVVVTDRVVSSEANIENLIIQGGDSGQRQLHQKIGSDKAPVNVATATLTLGPGASNGWHSHPGPLWAIIVSGTATFEDPEGCFADYPAGSVIFESGPTDIHNFLNRSTTENLVLRTWNFIPVGVPARIDQEPVIGPCE